MSTTILNYKENTIIPTVKNMDSPRSGAPVANQFVIDSPDGKTIFQSYDSVIAVIDYNDGGKVVLDEKKWNYSPTTSKYRNQFLGESTKETQAKINSGEYATAELN